MSDAARERRRATRQQGAVIDEPVEHEYTPEPEPATASARRSTLADQALASATWTPIDWTGHTPPMDRLHATHRAFVEHDGRTWPCYTLSDGRRVFCRYEDFAMPGDAGIERD